MAVIDRALAPWWQPIRALLGDQVLHDAHTHLGRNDPDNFKQTPAELISALDPVAARATTFAMHEPDGYPPANDEILAAVAEYPDRLVAFVRVDPRADAVAEARRCLDLGARGIKLHPRAEGFTLAEPAVADLFALAHERRAPILIHAGRGIPALGEHAVTLAGRFPDARVILAHAAVSDLAWLWERMPEHPNLLVDTSWWSPGDMRAMFELIPSGQIVWASDSPYGRPIVAAVAHLRFAIQAGVGGDALRSIAGGQIERVLAGAELERHGRPAGETEPLSPHLERVVSHLVAAVGCVVSGAAPTEQVALARLACDVGGGDELPLLERILVLLARWEEVAAGEGDEVRFPPSAALIVAAMSIARTPAAPLPG
jgi:predicted TIM-barrel fold metal-dependent hydrolase